MLHSVQVVFYRLLRETKAIRNFLVGQTFGDQWDQLLFAARQPHPLVHACGRKRGCLPLKIVEKQRAKRARAHRLARLHRPHPFHDVLRRSAFRKVSTDSCPHALQKLGLFPRNANQ